MSPRRGQITADTGRARPSAHPPAARGARGRRRGPLERQPAAGVRRRPGALPGAGPDDRLPHPGRAQRDRRPAPRARARPLRELRACRRGARPHGRVQRLRPRDRVHRLRHARHRRRGRARDRLPHHRPLPAAERRLRRLRAPRRTMRRTEARRETRAARLAAPRGRAAPRPPPRWRPAVRPATTPSSRTGALDVVAADELPRRHRPERRRRPLQVRSLVPLGTDPHSFEPTPRDLGEVAGADLVIVNGGGLEGPLLDTLHERRRRRHDRRGLRRPQEPHAAARRAAARGGRDRPALLARPHARRRRTWPTIRDAFAEADPAGAAEYEANAAAYIERAGRARRLDRGRRSTQIPPADRQLVMNHASHGYFADRYGFQIVGTVIPGAGDRRTTPTAQQLARPHGGHPRQRGQGDLRRDRGEPRARPADRRRDRRRRW